MRPAFPSLLLSALAVLGALHLSGGLLSAAPPTAFQGPPVAEGVSGIFHAEGHGAWETVFVVPEGYRLVLTDAWPIGEGLLQMDLAWLPQGAHEPEPFWVLKDQMHLYSGFVFESGAALQGWAHRDAALGLGWSGRLVPLTVDN